MRQFRLSGAAQSDVAEILAWSRSEFGNEAELRYETLIIAALRDAAAVRDGAGSTARPELGERVFSWHLRQSRDRPPGHGVRRPRHLIIYRLEEDRIIIGRILHEAMELQRHMKSATVWE